MSLSAGEAGNALLAGFGRSLAKVETVAATAAKENQNPDDGTASAVIITSAKAAEAAMAATAAAK